MLAGRNHPGNADYIPRPSQNLQEKLRSPSALDFQRCTILVCNKMAFIGGRRRTVGKLNSMEYSLKSYLNGRRLIITQYGKECFANSKSGFQSC
eukprot:1091247-Pelagomonas_calceolata.AAC.3